jgi:glycosyltransferase involved in cell wall biosynthesis
MMEIKNYVVIVPNLDDSGPVNFAIDLALEAQDIFHNVEIKYLKKNSRTRTIPKEVNASKISFFELFNMSGFLVHSHTIQADFLNLIIKIFNKNILSFTTIHNFFLEDMKYLKGTIFAWLSWLAWSKIVRRLDAAVCISTPMLDYYKGKGFKNVHLVYNFIRKPNDSASIVGELITLKSGRVDNFNLLFAGGLNERKNIKRLLKLANYDEVNLFVAGEGPFRDFVSDFASNADAIVYLGFRNDLENIFPYIDALILPSFSEGFPLVCLESLSHGKPCLLSNIPVHRELAELGFGVVFDHIGFSDLPQAIEKLADQAFSSAALKTLFRQRFSSQIGFQNYLALYLAVSEFRVALRH